MQKWEFVGGISIFFWFIFCVHFFLPLKVFWSSYNILTDWALLDPEEEPLLFFLGFSEFLSFLFFFSPHLLHWLSDFSGLSAVGYFIRNKSILLMVFFCFFFNDTSLHQNGNWVKLGVSLANMSDASYIGNIMSFS